MILFASLTYRFQYRQQQNINFISAILQHAKVQLTQQCKTFILNIYIYITNNKHFLYKNLFDITFTLYNVLKLRAYLFGLLDKDPCDSIDLKLNNSLSCILWWSCRWSWSLGSWVKARFIHYFRLGVIIHLRHSQN